jgi:hypothetical protein
LLLEQGDLTSDMVVVVGGQKISGVGVGEKEEV